MKTDLKRENLANNGVVGGDGRGGDRIPSQVPATVAVKCCRVAVQRPCSKQDQLVDRCAYVKSF